MTARKEALERRISELQGEREGLSCDLDETEERILALERQNREQDNQVRKKKNCISHKNRIFDLLSLLSYGV